MFTEGKMYRFNSDEYYENKRKEYEMEKKRAALPYWERLSAWGKIWRIVGLAVLLLFLLLLGVALRIDTVETFKMLAVSTLVFGFFGCMVLLFSL